METQMRHAESALQSSCVQWFRLQYPALALHLFAIGNGVPANARQGAIRKREGSVPGVADLFLMVPSGDLHGLFIEMKSPTGTVSQAQKDFIIRATDAGYVHSTCRSIEQFMAVIRIWLKGVNITETCCS
jgi:hypothetical protein